MDSWFLEGSIEAGRSALRMNMESFPFTVGRFGDVSLALNSSEVSRTHAEMHLSKDQLILTDCNSMNGTFINQKRVINPALIKQGDTIRFGNMDFRIGRRRGVSLIESALDSLAPVTSATITSATTNQKNSRSGSGHSLIRQSIDLSDCVNSSCARPAFNGFPERLLTQETSTQEAIKSLIDNHQIDTVFQAFFDSSHQRLSGYEVLVRGNHPALPTNPIPLFVIAKAHDLEVELSRSMRRLALDSAARSKYAGLFFLNAHGSELTDLQSLFVALRDQRLRHPELNWVLEFNDKCLGDAQQYRQLRMQLNKLGIPLAIQNFNGSRSRITELMQHPPQYIKFGKALIGNIENSATVKMEILKSLLQQTRDKNIKAIAMGVDNAKKANCCTDLGFDFLQGYFLGRPKAQI